MICCLSPLSLLPECKLWGQQDLLVGFCRAWTRVTIQEREKKMEIMESSDQFRLPFPVPFLALWESFSHWSASPPPCYSWQASESNSNQLWFLSWEPLREAGLFSQDSAERIQEQGWQGLDWGAHIWVQLESSGRLSCLHLRANQPNNCTMS